MEAVMRASTLSETRGFIRTLFEPDGNRILGFTGFDFIADSQSRIKGRLVRDHRVFQTTIAATGTKERLFPKWRVLVRPTKCVQLDHLVNA